MLAATPASATTLPQWLTRIVQNVQQGEVVSREVAEDNRRQITCVALGVYYESRGEPLRGQKAVASVIMNRVRSGKYPDSACGVILQKGQFSFVRPSLKPSGKLWDQALGIAETYVSKASGDIPHLSFTASNRIKGLRIGHHVFY